MNHVATQVGMTPEEFNKLSDGVGYELVNGELKDRHGSALSSWVGGQIAMILATHTDNPNLGWVFGAKNGYQCFPGQPRTVRKPNVSFVRLDRLSAEEIQDGWLRVVPDLVGHLSRPLP